MSVLAAIGLSAFGTIASAEAPTAPIAVQAQILARILPFERGFAERAKDRVLVVIAERDGNADSTSAARQLSRALSDIGSVAGKKLAIRTVSFSGAAALASECRDSGAHALYLSPGLSSEVPAIASALSGTRVLSLAAVESYVPRGAVLGVEVIDGKPRMSINLAQAKRQRLDFPSALLRLARIY